ncbi:hypothetical protein LCE31_38050 [Streptomyces sp. 8L]|nr:hypothetical protein [Streptomyces sp. 8L]MCA1224045.1 hypothetical protein [Streptomyces sp. 8L]
MRNFEGLQPYGAGHRVREHGGRQTARVARVVWDMGDGGQPVTFTAPGTPYDASYGLKTFPDCGYRYTRPSTTAPGDRYSVTARATWDITWTVAGQSDALTATRGSAGSVRGVTVCVIDYSVTATATWDITWTGAGQTGALTATSRLRHARSLGIVRVDQCESPEGGAWSGVRATRDSTCSSVIFRGAPERGASTSPSTPPTIPQR